ncbi:MAG: sensor signal transduction histidine kinase [Verrucomicrobiales bacterium]|nr:sensor signal transduction histidine kinase [Verrucomicrobiales bacterium]
MHPFRNLPIRRKITLIIMLSTCIALLLACAAFVTYDQTTFRKTMARDFSILANMINDAAAPGLAFNDANSIEQTLKTLAADPHIMAAGVYDKAGKLVSRYLRKDLEGSFTFPKSRRTGSAFKPQRLDTFQDITLTGDFLGNVYIGSDLTEIDLRLGRFLIIVGLVLLISLLAAFGVAAKLQTMISGPILHLASTAALVANEKNYSVRAVKHGNDELGSLIDGFNEMLSQIQKQDNALQEARDTLEARVENRTQALKQEIAERKHTELALHESESFAKSILNSLAANIAVLDDAGNIVAVNKVWENFVREHGEDSLAGTRPGINYLEVLRKIPGKESAQASEGIFAVLGGSMEEFNLEYPCHSKKEQRWFMLYVTPLFQTQGGAVVAHIDVTERKRAEAELEALHKQLMDASRQAGMAEVATGVLHNVGNVLNSVNVTATLVTEQLRKSRAADLPKVVGLLKANESNLGAFLTSDSKGRKIIEFLGQLSDRIQLEQRNQIKELESLCGNIEHIKDIVAMQQSYAKVSGMVETVNVLDLVEDTLRMNAGALARHDVKVIREFAAVPPIMTEKHKVLQILVNLVRNAKYACDDSSQPEKILTVRLAESEDKVTILVADNGVGIARENLTRIFNHGFTTRKDGHGFGLHSGALAAKELGGTLTVQSDGPGMGATFCLELPLQRTLHEQKN